MDSKTKKQLNHCYAQEPIDDDNNITIWALGGFVPENEDEAQEFLKECPPYKMTFGPPRVKVRVSSVIRQENEYRMALVQRMNDFLTALREGRCSVRRACKVSGLNRTLAESLRLKVLAFDQLWTEISAEVTDELEEAAFTRAIEGVERAVYYQGIECGREVHYSDSLLSMLLQGRRPEVYKQRTSTEISGDPSKPLKHEITDRTLTKEELIAELQARGLPTTLLKD